MQLQQMQFHNFFCHNLLSPFISFFSFLLLTLFARFHAAISQSVHISTRVCQQMLISTEGWFLSTWVVWCQIHEAAGRLVIAANQRSDDVRLTQSSDQFGSRSRTRLPTQTCGNRSVRRLVSFASLLRKQDYFQTLTGTTWRYKQLLFAKSIAADKVSINHLKDILYSALVTSESEAHK